MALFSTQRSSSLAVGCFVSVQALLVLAALASTGSGAHALSLDQIPGGEACAGREGAAGGAGGCTGGGRAGRAGQNRAGRSGAGGCAGARLSRAGGTEQAGRGG